MSLISFLSKILTFSQEESPVFLLVGLGNPGEQHKKNRHNIGFMAIDEIAKSYGFPAFKSKFQGSYSEGRIGAYKVGLLKPATFMNESGRSVGVATQFYKISSAHIIVFHDELDLPPSKVKIKVGGGHAGHNGLRSLDAHLGDKNYKRVRMGIGHPRDLGGDKNGVSSYVLSNFPKADHKWLENVLYGTEKNIELLLDKKNDEFMTRVAEITK